MAAYSRSRRALIDFEASGTCQALPAAALDSQIVFWFDELRGPVLAYLVSIGSRHCEAEEIVQETFVALHRHFERGGDERNIRGWIFRVAHNLYLNSRKASKYEGQVHSEAWAALSERAVDPATAPEQAMLDAERRQRLDEAIARLSPQQWQCLNLRAEGFRYREIADILGVTTSTVAELLRRAIKKLRKDTHEA